MVFMPILLGPYLFQLPFLFRKRWPVGLFATVNGCVHICHLYVHDDYLIIVILVNPSYIYTVLKPCAALQGLQVTVSLLYQ